MKLSELGILGIWQSLGGGPLRGKRARAFWRDGDGYNIALDTAKGTWYDHRDARGGGLLDLVMVALGFDRGAALTWLRQHCGLDPRRPLSPEELRERANRHARAKEVAERVMHWHAGLLRDLEQAKLLTYQEYLTHPGEQTDNCWENACRRLREAQQLGGAALVAAYRNAAEQDADAVERFIKAAREDVAHAELYTGLVVALLGVSAIRERQHE